MLEPTSSPLEYFDLRMGPDVPLDRIEHVLHLTGRAGDGSEAEPTSLPAILVPNLGDGHTEPSPTRLE